MTDDRRANAEAFVGRNLLDAMIDELKTTDEAWSKLSKEKQDDTIDRIRARIQSSVRMALEGVLSGNAPAVAATLGKVTFNSKGISCDLSLDKHMKARHELADHAGQTIVVLLADPEEYFAGMDEVHGEPDQRWLFDAAPDGVDPETGEVVEPESEASAATKTDADPGHAESFADAASLIPRFAALGITLPMESAEWPAAVSQVRDLFVYADALEAGFAPQLPYWLNQFVNDDAPHRLDSDPQDTELAELVLALRANNVARATIERCAAWSAEDRQDVWDWIEVTESGELPADGTESRTGFEAGAKLVEALNPDDEDEGPAVQAFNPAELNERLRGVGIAVPGTVVSSWSDGEVEAVQRYIDEFSDESGPAELPECLEPYVQPGLAHQAGAGEPAMDEWAILRAEPAKLAVRLRAHNIPVPDHEAYAWTADERDLIIDYLRAVLTAAETGAALAQPAPAKLEPYLSTPGPDESEPNYDPDGSGDGGGMTVGEAGKGSIPGNGKATKKKTGKKKASKKKTRGKAKGGENGASTDPPPQE